MKTFMTTAAIIAALTIPALAQQENRGESHGATKATTNAKQGNGPDAKIDQGSLGMSKMAPSTTGAKELDRSLTGDDKGSGQTGSSGDGGGTSGGGAGDGGGGGNGNGK